MKSLPYILFEKRIYSKWPARGTNTVSNVSAHFRSPLTAVGISGVCACGWRLSGQRASTTVSRVLSDTDGGGGGGGGAGGGAGGGGGLPVWRGANMAQSQLMQRRRQDAQRVP